MARRCTICTHPDRPAIDAALVNRRPLRNIAQHFGVSVWAALRHHDGHLAEALSRAKRAEETADADGLLAQLEALRNKSMGLLLSAERAGDLRTALRGVAEARSCIELLAEMSRQLDRRPAVNLLLAPEWLAVRSALLDALRPFPAARIAVAERLTTLEVA